VLIDCGFSTLYRFKMSVVGSGENGQKFDF
jgi:hypothetical protein